MNESDDSSTLLIIPNEDPIVDNDALVDNRLCYLILMNYEVMINICESIMLIFFIISGFTLNSFITNSLIVYCFSTVHSHYCIVLQYFTTFYIITRN